MGSIRLKGVTLLGNRKNRVYKSDTSALTMSEPISSNVNNALTKNLNQIVKINDKKNKSNNDSSSYDEGSGSSGESSGGDGSSSGGSSTSNYTKSAMSKSEKQKLYKMKDSNVPYYYDHDENDLMYLAASEKRDYAWGMKEEVFLYTMHDRQKHKYITSFSIDSDSQDICTTCTIDMPYKEELMDYYIPSKTVFMIIGGVYDREVLFIGRVSEIAQMGDSIQVTGQNIGWKFKQYMPMKVYKKLKGLPVPLAAKYIFKKLGFTGGKYHMDLWAIPNVFKYKVDEDCTIKYKGETVQNVPELTDVVDRMKEADINKYVASQAKVKSTQAAADSYDKKTLISLSSVWKSSQSGYSTPYRKSYGISTKIKNGEVSYDPLEDRLLGLNKKVEYFTNHSGGYSEYTYEDVMKNICAAIDAQFFIVDTTVCLVSFNALMAMGSSEAIVKAIQPRIEYWQLQDNTFELDVNQYGYYNTVIIKYKNGTLKRSFEDLVRVYDEIPITYEEPDLNYQGAQLKAQAYLAAHVRDFGMQVRATILYTGKITVASFIKVQNPLTMSESLLYVYGQSIQWDAGGQTITSDLDLRYGPENPDNPEIPEYGLSHNKRSSSSSGNVTDSVSANVESAAQEMINGCVTNEQKAEAIYKWFAKNIKYRMYRNSDHSVSATLQGRSSNCYDSSICGYQLFTAAGIKCQFIHGTLASRTYNGGHYWLKIWYNNNWEIVDLGRSNKQGIGSSSGKLIGGKVEQKNY